MKLESLCLHAGYSPENGQPRVLPIAQSTTFKYASTAEVAKLFDLTEAGFFYTRLGNPTVDAVEQKIAALEGGVGALCTSSGQAANMLAVLNLARSGDHLVSAASIYGGTFNLFAVTLKRLGIEVTFVDQTASDEELEKAFRSNTRAVFGETLSNPTMNVLDIGRFARLAHRRGLPREDGGSTDRPRRVCGARRRGGQAERVSGGLHPHLGPGQRELHWDQQAQGQQEPQEVAGAGGVAAAQTGREQQQGQQHRRTGQRQDGDTQKHYLHLNALPYS